MGRLLLLIAFALGVILAIHWFIRTPPKQALRTFKRAGLVAAGVILIALAATGRLSWLFALIGSALAFLPRLLPLLRYVPLFKGLYHWIQSNRRARAAAAGARPGISSVASRYLRMELDHTSGELDGEVIDGSQYGMRLADLDRAALERLWAEIADDADSRALLRSYLERRFSGWSPSGGDGERRDTGGDGSMSPRRERSSAWRKMRIGMRSSPRIAG